MSFRPTVVVVGGGLAGIAAAVRLADRGVGVTLVETRNRLGGRATSFEDPASGRTLDNCQHVLMGCCTNLMALYRRLGVEHLIQWHRRLYFTDGTGVIDELEADDLPAPLHLLTGLAGFRTLSAWEKLAIGRAMVAMIRLGRSGRENFRGVTFADWLEQQGQPAGAVRKFWSVIVTSALNETPERASAAYAIQVFQEGFLPNEQAYLMGLSAVPLVTLYDQAYQVIQRAGGRVMLSTSAERFEFDGRRVTGLRLGDGSEAAAEGFVAAVPFDRLAKLCPPAMVQADARLGRLGEFTTSPIIGIHLWMSRGGAEDGRVVMELPHLILMQSPVHWIFNKGVERDPGTGLAGCQHLHGVVSAAHELVDQSAQGILAMAVEEVRKALAGRPGGAEARLVHGRVIKEKRATFAATPVADSLRPAARGEIENLFLAGDWCRTGWPATMEGAVRSGFLAAQGVLGSEGEEGAGALEPDLPMGSWYRMLAR